MCKDNADDPICLHAADTCHKSPGEAEVNRNLLVQVPEPLRVFGIKGEFKSSYATQTSKICFTYFLHSDRCQNIHTSSVHSRLRAECDWSQHDYTTMNVADIKFLLRVQKAETIDFNDTSPLSVMTHPPPRVLGWVECWANQKTLCRQPGQWEGENVTSRWPQGCGHCHQSHSAWQERPNKFSEVLGIQWPIRGQRICQLTNQRPSNCQTGSHCHQPHISCLSH